ncbi:hypothetical protein MCOR27_000222 [Pyricularia oryzae]|uniref:Uncharacterized protein n=2 Tax=Pyricularia TaxID=48558 RepID=A0ABQ8P479_PYRGI|nr:hypothetical protein MCOR01_004658 [Pyricularia oryzae]KAI6305035.1 hypothetical protein MCOR33_000154 [Pyricularia grisea]KAH9431355.1 hypothetical protein MCOR02_008648 [Pyricularia oryzae]KAI6261916.1 hypothetical protein MCOR19_001865 [Pyricularia oryzae]KAI6287929.1 hypothetical protein MCOR26_000341 [Pyricularia oryzae]
MLVSTRPAGPLRRLPLCLSLASKPVHCSPCSLRQASIHRGPTLVPTQRRSFIIPSNNMDLKSSSFTNAVVSAMRSLYPEELADRAWDNVGLLLENTEDPGLAPVVLLTNDLTGAVVDEAIAKNASVIVSYHPPIFRGLKSITLKDPQQQLLLQLVKHNIAVYSPHTAVDATPGGLNDWLADLVSAAANDFPHVKVERTNAKPVTSAIPAGFEGAGYGRVCKFSEPIPWPRVVHAVAQKLGQRYVSLATPRGFPKGMPRGDDASTPTVTSVAVCAGSGADVLGGCGADMLITGEMSHHAALHATMRGQMVMTVFHSNSERRFLRDVMQGKLSEAVRAHFSQTASVLVSEADSDPFEVWDLNSV